MPNDLPDTSDAAIGARLALVRAARGHHMAAFARLLELSPQRLNSYEKGRTSLPFDMIGRIWQFTGATPDYLVFGKLDGLPSQLVLLLRQAEKHPVSDGRRKKSE